MEAARERVGRGLPAEEPLPAHAYVVASHDEPESDAPHEIAEDAVGATAGGTEGAGAQ